LNFEELEALAEDIRSTPNSSVAREGCLEMFDLIEEMHDELFKLHIENKNLRNKFLHRKNKWDNFTEEDFKEANRVSKESRNGVD
jgi:hypothetical protein